MKISAFGLMWNCLKVGWRIATKLNHGTSLLFRAPQSSASLHTPAFTMVAIQGLPEQLDAHIDLPLPVTYEKVFWDHSTLLENSCLGVFGIGSKP